MGVFFIDIRNKSRPRQRGRMTNGKKNALLITIINTTYTKINTAKNR